MITITSKDIFDFLNSNEGTLAEWWWSKLDLRSRQHIALARSIQWDVKISKAVDLGDMYYWMEITTKKEEAKDIVAENSALLVKLTS